ncbi:carbohydrate esterase family 4 protein [Tulasnella calospora MUT 4182]|uniref:Carbohydrate esterase family 4 protein n=1 Tax=Tulasnella calospora MUT 4182 TaxID=1051891 RepID=A0A0C3QCL7_9AGAM|nr:carbohydrate esterase family 4 protein [Tulasnella calospora MUT 4182]
MKTLSLALATTLITVANAQSQLWGQCGGQGWTGATTCVAGATCVYSNAWYSQCLPGSSGGTTTTTQVTTTTPGGTTTTTTAGNTGGGTELPLGTLVTGCTKPGTIAITFDDGPYQWTSALIDSLNAAGVKATFFMCGKLYGCIYDYADVVKKAHNSGHQVASHTWDHPHLPQLSTAQITTEITKLETAFKKILGIKPRWIRPPYGETNSQVLSTLGSLGYKAVSWNLDSQDWNGYSVAQSQAVFNALGSDPKIIPLEHDALQSTAQTLGPWIANWAKNKGLKAVTLSECLGEPIPQGQYTNVGGATAKDSTWVC